MLVIWKNTLDFGNKLKMLKIYVVLTILVGGLDKNRYICKQKYYYNINKNMSELNFNEIFARRLQNARKMCGFSQAELASRMRVLETKCPVLYKSVSSTAIEKYEKGVMSPDNDIIITTIARALDTNVGNLHRPFTVHIDINNFEFRKKSKLGKKAVEKIKLKVQERIEKYVEIERICDEEPHCKVNFSDVVVECDEDARNIAVRLRNEWQLGMGPILNPINVLENNGVKVIEVNEDPELFDGTSTTVEGIPVVILNANDEKCSNPKHQNSSERRNLTLFHELGHQLMNISDDVTPKEREALCNVFANEMLIPSETFKWIFGERRSSISLFELKDVQKEYGISARALMYKAAQLGVISQSKYKYFCIELNVKESLRRIIDETMMKPQHSSRFERLVYRALATEIISISKAAELLDESVSQILKNYNLKVANAYNN